MTKLRGRNIMARGCVNLDTYAPGLFVGIYEKSRLFPVDFWYSVGESNPYCKIENLEY